MYKCNDCERIFEEPDFYTEDPSPSGISLPAGEYRYDICPYCGSDDFEEYEEPPEDAWGTDDEGEYIFEDEEGNLIYEDGEIYQTAQERNAGQETTMFDTAGECRKYFDKKREEIRNEK